MLLLFSNICFLILYYIRVVDFSLFILCVCLTYVVFVFSMFLWFSSLF